MSQHVQDAAVFERRLRPIYDNLEVGNNRKALQETEKLLKKQPNLLCARALKGLALLRLGRYEESNQYLQPLTEEKSVDDATLQVLSFCYKELEQLDKIVELYDHAVKEAPGNEELLAHLFISHVRIEDFKAQQTSAWQLYKAHPKNAYYFWAVMSVVLQGIRGPESKNPDKRKLFLELAQRMVEKMIKENKLESEQEAMLYLNILKMQDKYEQALSFLNDNSRHLTHSTPVSIKIDLLKKVERWQEVQILLMELLTEERDRWDYYQDFLTACFHLLKTAKDNPTRDGEDNVDAGLSILDTCHDFICQKIESGAKKMRGPYLARLELHKRMRAENLDAQALLGDFSELVIEYFRLFGDKTCCTHDITLFLQSIGMKERQELASKLLLESGISSTTLPQNKEQMQKHICALQISRICGSHIDLEKEHLLAFYTALKLHYEHGLRSFGQNLLPTDMGPSDPYALLAANVMYDISLKEQRSDHLFEALCLLQYVLRNSTSNFHVKLLSLKIYHMFGCVLGAQEMYDYLDIKQIQLDSMGYIHCNLLPLSGRFSLARTLFDSTLKFFSNSYKERLEYITLTYRFCSFNKLEEFMNFKERLTNSLHYVRASVEAQLCDFVTLYGNFTLTHTGMSVDPAEERILWDDLHDNRDLSAIVRWDPLHLVNVAEERTESFTQEKEVLRIRSLLLRLISSFVDLYNQPFVRYMKKPGTTNSNSNSNSSTPSSNNANANANSNSNSTHNSNHADENNHHQESPAKDTETIEMLHDKWIALFQRLRSLNYKPLSNRFLVNLLPTSLHLLLDMPYEKFFADLSQLILDFYNGDHNLPLQCSQMSKNVVDVVELCSQAIAESNCACKDGLWRRREWQSKVAAGVEMLCLYAFVLSTLQEKMQSSSRPKAKRKSTENNQQQQPYVKEKERSQLLGELMRQLKKKLEICENALQNWKSPSLPRDLNSFMSDMSLTPEVEATLIGDVATVFRTSHEHMVTELKGLIKEKMRLMTK